MSKVTQSQQESIQTIDFLSWSSGDSQPITKTNKTAEILSFSRAITPPKRTSKFSSVSDFISELELDGTHKNGISEARKWIADTQYAQSVKTLKIVRLSKGLSQKALAKLTETSQPHIARIESGREDVRLSTLRKLAEALDLTLDEMSALIENQERLNSEANK